MDVLNLWNDDPEEVLLDLGFGCDEPDLSGRIPARFINHQSQARGINLQVFLEAQKNRLDLENPDVSNRFRQLEVLQQVTTAFSSLVGSSSPSYLRVPLAPEAQDRRRHVGMLFRRASKKSLSQIHNQKNQDVTTPTPTTASPESTQPPTNHGDKKVPSKRPKPGVLENVGLSPLAEEQGAGPDSQPQPHVIFHIGQDGALRPWYLKEGHPLTTTTFSPRSSKQTSESFEMEEINSFDDSSVTGSCLGGAEHLARTARGVTRTNSCQSDSSGFLEEPFILSLPQQPSPGPDLIKALSGLSGGSTDNQGSGKLGSPCSSPPHTSSSHILSSSLNCSDVDKCLPYSPCPLPGPCLVFGPTHSLCLPNNELKNSKDETPPHQDQSPPGVFSEFVFEYFPPCSSSLEPQNITDSQSLTLPSPTLMIPVSLTRGSEDTETEDKDTPNPHDPKGTPCPTCSSVAPSPSPSPKLDYSFSASVAMYTTQSDFCSGSPGNLQCEWTEVGLYPSAPPDIHYPPSYASPPLIKSQSPENKHKDSVVPDVEEVGLSETYTNTKKGQNETPLSFSFQLDKNYFSLPSPLVLDSCTLKEGCLTLRSLSPSPSIPVCQSALCTQSHDSEDLMDPAAGKSSDIEEKSTSQQDQSCSHDDNTDPTLASPFQDVICVKMDHLYLDINDFQRHRGGEDERHSYIVQTQDTFAYVSDTKSFSALSEGSKLAFQEICDQTLVPSCGMLDELSAESKKEELQKVCQMETSCTEKQLTRRCLVLNDFAEVHRRTEVELKNLIEIENLDQVFETSVDDSEGENIDMEAFFEQLDAEGQIYWAEPIQVSNPTHQFKESCSFETSDGSPGNSLLSRGSPALESVSSTDKSMPFSSPATMGAVFSDRRSSSSTTLDLKPSSHSVSVQMSSSLSSHIVHRKDVPYMTDSKCTRLPGVLPLDTSTPFRALQTWTDMQIERNTLIKKLSQGSLHPFTNKEAISMDGSETTQRPTLTFSPAPSFPPHFTDWQSNGGLPGISRNYQTVSVSVDTGLCPDEEEVDRNVHEDEEKLGEGNQTATMTCCCSCDHQCTCCAQKICSKQHTLGNMPYSLGDLEQMMLCLQRFRSVLSNMEEQLSEDQAEIYTALSDQDRERVRDIGELREAVKQEAAELEMQLNELAHYYDDSLKMKMDRLLDEQSLLCCQLRIFLPGTAPTSLSPTPCRTVATQCCLLPRVASVDMQNDRASSWNTWTSDSLRQSPPGSENICKGIKKESQNITS